MSIRVNKWGGTCSSEYSFNSGRLRRGLCEPWQTHLYGTWYNHGNGDPTSPRSIHPGNPFMSFDYFYNWCLKQSWIDRFKVDHEMFELDKDMLGTRNGNREFHPDTVTLLTKVQNCKEMLQRTGNPGAQLAKDARAQKVICEVSGKLVEYVSCSECARSLGVSPETVCNWISGRRLGYLKHGIKSIYYK